jgi:hypothetical protein
MRIVAGLPQRGEGAIDRLIPFLDESDDQTTWSGEPDRDELDASYPESGAKVTNPVEDDEEDDAGEDDGTGEWRLGFDGPNPFAIRSTSARATGRWGGQSQRGEPDDDGEPEAGDRMATREMPAVTTGN